MTTRIIFKKQNILDFYFGKNTSNIYYNRRNIMGQIHFGNDQLRAIKMARDWFKTGDFIRNPIFVIGGFARHR